MQNNDPSRAKTYDFEAFKESALPLKEHFYEVESNKFLLGYRHIWVSLMLRILLAAILSFGVPIYLVLIWFVASLICNYYIGRESKMFTTLLFAKPMFMTEQMKRCVKNFKCTWHVNAIVWGSSGILAQIWLSDIARVLSLTTLTAVVYLFLTRNCANKKLMHEVSFLILGIPFIAATCRIILSDPTSQSLLLFSGHAFHISLTAFMVVLIGGRLNKSFKQHCVAEYAQLKLIESLEQSREKLRVEQAALTDANTVIQQFYSAAAHDLRQPVYAMELYSDMLHDDPSQMARLLPKISQSCMSINAMFNELFDFQQKHLSDVKLEKTTVCISETFKNLALHFEPIAASKNLGISFKPLEGSINIIPLYFVRILSNLIANAITYTPSGRILVAARKSGEYLSFEIWDTGTGIEKAAQDKIFLEFYKINAAGKKTSNLGLGLAIVKELVQRMEHAKIRVNSIMGHGSVFKLLLPIETYLGTQKPQIVESSMHYSL